jgi:hypothetical protein
MRRSWSTIAWPAPAFFASGQSTVRPPNSSSTSVNVGTRNVLGRAAANQAPASTCRVVAVALSRS